MKLVRFLPLALLPLLGGCINDAASYMMDGRDNALTLIREQKYFWDKKVDLALVVARLPECQRRHSMGSGPAQAAVEVWQPGPGTYIVRQGDRMFLTETQTCEGWQRLEGEPPGGLGQQLGSFREKDGKLRFVPAATVQGQ